YLKDIQLASSVSASSTMKTTIEKADIIIIAVPSHAMGIVTKQLKTNIKRSIPIVSATKGLTASGKVMTETLERNLSIPSRYVFALSGPSIASELAEGKMTELVLGGDKRIARSLKRELSTSTVALRITSDKTGIQLLGFYKNIIAIMVGICEGLELGTNTTSALVTKAYRELYRRNLMRMRRHTFIDYSGLGDLLVTLYSPQSRNHRFGVLIGTGHAIGEAKKRIGQSIEGLNAIDILSP
ncbi:MAG: NAD(P)H-dependent glycerol-3-phosphate dehydrogenase, partial [Nanoarchaeota archaeon]